MCSLLNLAYVFNLVIKVLTFAFHSSLPISCSYGQVPIGTEHTVASTVNNQPYYELPTLTMSVRKNNTICSVADAHGRNLATVSCGTEGFTNARKTSTVAAQSVGLSIGLKAQKHGVNSVRVVIRGIGVYRAVCSFF